MGRAFLVGISVISLGGDMLQRVPALLLLLMPLYCVF